MTNFRRTLLAVGIGLALGFSAGTWADADIDTNDSGVNAAVDTSAVAKDENSAAANNKGKANAGEAEAKNNGAAAANNKGIAVAGEAEAEDKNSAAANNKSSAFAGEAEAKDEGAVAASGGSSAYADNSENSTASAKGDGDALSAQNGGEIEVNSASVGGDGNAFNVHRGGEVKIDESTRVDLDGEIKDVNVVPIGVALYNGLPVEASANSIDNSVNGTAGIVQLSQNLGHASLVQQSTNVFGTVNVNK